MGHPKKVSEERQKKTISEEARLRHLRELISLFPEMRSHYLSEAREITQRLRLQNSPQSDSLAEA